MRDFRDAKAMARALRTALAAKGLKITVGESLELVAALFGVRDWNTLSAQIGAEAAPAAENPSPTEIPEPARGQYVGFAAALEATLRRAVSVAKQGKQEYATLEHLLLALIDDPDAAAVIAACQVDPAVLRRTLTDFVDANNRDMAAEAAEEPRPTDGFQRVMQRAVIHVRSAGLAEVRGANVLIALFSERESRAAACLLEQGMTRHDAVNFVAHGVAQDRRPSGRSRHL